MPYKNKMKGKGKGMSSPKGLYSTKDNPMGSARQQHMSSSGVNADANKVMKLAKQAYKRHESLRIQGK